MSEFRFNRVTGDWVIIASGRARRPEDYIIRMNRRDMPCTCQCTSTALHRGTPEVAMASENVKELTDTNFESEVLKSDVPTLVDFWAVWCGPCKQIAPTVDALATEYKGRLKVAKMDVDHHQIVPQQYRVTSIPTLLIFKGGKVVGQLVGAVPRSKLEAEIQKHL